MIQCTCTFHARDAKCPVGQEVGKHPRGAVLVLYGSYEAAMARVAVCGETLAEPKRPSWDQYFLTMAKIVASRATCDRKHVGAIIVDDRNRIVSTGYNGSARGLPHCDDEGHLMKEVDGRESCVRTLHAESNALDDAGRRAEGGTIYITVIPCFNCAKRIVNAGIKRVVWSEYYESQNTSLVTEFFGSAGVIIKEGLYP